MRKRTIRPEIVKFITLPSNEELSQQSNPDTSKAIVMRDYITKIGKKPTTDDFFRAGYKNVAFSGTTSQSFFTIKFDDGSSLKIEV